MLTNQLIASQALLAEASRASSEREALNQAELQAAREEATGLRAETTKLRLAVQDAQYRGDEVSHEHPRWPIVPVDENLPIFWLLSFGFFFLSKSPANNTPPLFCRPSHPAVSVTCHLTPPTAPPSRGV